MGPGISDCCFYQVPSHALSTQTCVDLGVFDHHLAGRRSIIDQLCGNGAVLANEKDSFASDLFVLNE